jgi:transcriptional regulator with XRE-family HTH domain
MKKETLASAFAEARNKAGLTMLGMAMKCDVAETTVWKVEKGKSVRWETVHLILTVALRIKQGTEEYQKFQDLWLADRRKMAAKQSPEFATKQMSPHAETAVRRFRKIVRDMDEESTEKLMRSIDRAVVKIFMAS